LRFDGGGGPGAGKPLRISLIANDLCPL
jgi:hypothetical protein